MNSELKKRCIKCLVWSVVLYAAKTQMYTDESGRSTVGGFRNVDMAKNGKK